MPLLSITLHRYSLSLSRNFLKLKLDYKSYMYMLNYIYIYIYMAVDSATYRNAKSTTARLIDHCRYLEITFDHCTIHLRWSSVGCSSDRCRPILSAAGEIWTCLLLHHQCHISDTRSCHVSWVAEVPHQAIHSRPSKLKFSPLIWGGVRYIMVQTNYRPIYL